MDTTVVGETARIPNKAPIKARPGRHCAGPGGLGRRNTPGAVQGMQSRGGVRGRAQRTPVWCVPRSGDRGRRQPEGGRGEAAPEFPSGVRLAKFPATLSSRYGQPDSLASGTGDQGAHGRQWPAAQPAGQWSRLAGQRQKSPDAGDGVLGRADSLQERVAEVTTDSHDQNKCLCVVYSARGAAGMADATKEQMPGAQQATEGTTEAQGLGPSRPGKHHLEVRPCLKPGISPSPSPRIK